MHKLLIFSYYFCNAITNLVYFAMSLVLVLTIITAFEFCENKRT